MYIIIIIDGTNQNCFYASTRDVTQPA